MPKPPTKPPEKPEKDDILTRIRDMLRGTKPSLLTELSASVDTLCQGHGGIKHDLEEIKCMIHDLSDQIHDLADLTRSVKDDTSQTLILVTEIHDALPTEPPKPPKATRLGGSFGEITQEGIVMIPTGNHFWDQVGLQFNLSPNGSTDAPPTWSVDPAELGVGLTPAADGLSATLFATQDILAFTVTAQAPADNPTTPELESVSESFTGSFSHSKATSLGGSFNEVPVPTP